MLIFVIILLSFFFFTKSLKKTSYHDIIVLISPNKFGGIRDMEKKPVFCVNDGMVYESCTAAANAYGLPLSYVSKQVNGKIKRTANYVFLPVRGNESREELSKLQSDALKKYLHILLLF